MMDGNGDVAKALPSQLSDALRTARAGRRVSLDVLRGAVCTYVDQLLAGGLPRDAMRLQVIRAFDEVNADAPRADGVIWSEEFVDELLLWCRERALKSGN